MFEELADLKPAGLIAEIDDAVRSESVTMARRLAAIALLLRRRTQEADAALRVDPYSIGGFPRFAHIEGYERTCAEVAAVMNMSPVGASYQVHYAEVLDTRLPSIATLLASGQTDWRTVRLIISRTDLVNDDDLIARLDERLDERLG
jgi:hypothetical protein